MSFGPSNLPLTECSTVWKAWWAVPPVLEGVFCFSDYELILCWFLLWLFRIDLDWLCVEAWCDLYATVFSVSCWLPFACC